ncbi:MAG: hypothetical protein AAB397_03665 [Patescibacteria group bacterium]
MVDSSDKENGMHEENIRILKFNFKYENVEIIYSEKLEYYKYSRIRIFIPIFVMRDVLEALKTSLKN